MLKCVRTAAVIILAVCSLLSGCQKAERKIKDIVSENVGLSRTINVLNIYGDVIRTYEGNVDIAETEGWKVKFDLDGKRYIYYNCSLEVIEK